MPNINFNLLRQSSLDTVELGRAVEDKFLDLMATYLRIKGECLAVPASLNPDMLRWREMRVRHKRGQLENTEAELKSVQTIAQWTVDVNMALRGQPTKRIQWVTKRIQWA